MGGRFLCSLDLCFSVSSFSVLSLKSYVCYEACVIGRAKEHISRLIFGTLSRFIVYFLY